MVQTAVRFPADTLRQLGDRAADLTRQSPTHEVTVSDVVRIAVHYYLATAPADPGQVFGPDRWIRT